MVYGENSVDGTLTMRTVSANLLSAIENQPDSKPSWKATVYNTRAFTDSYWTDYYVSEMLDKPQSYCWHSGDSLFYTIYNDGGTLKGVKSNSTFVYTVNVSNIDQYTRPLILYVGGTLYLWYVTTGYILTRAILNSSFQVVSSITYSIGVSQCAILPGYGTNNDPQNEVIVLDINNGAYRIRSIRYADPSWIEQIWDGRIAYPDRKIALAELKYTAAISLLVGTEKRTYIYVSDSYPTTSIGSGQIYGVYFDYTNLEWSDVFVAIPADLSVAWCNNGMNYNGVMYMAVGFKRKDVVSNSTVYTQLISKSTDGINWSLEENDLFTDLDYYFQLYISSSYIYMGINNRFLRAARPGTITLDIPEDDIVSLQVSSQIGDASATMVLRNGDEKYTDNALMIEGNKVVLSMGYSTGASVEYIDYSTYYIDGINQNFGDANRNYSIHMTHEGSYKISNYVHPVYSEIETKTYNYDNCQSEGDFYAAANGGISQDWLDVDFWKSEPYEYSGSTPVSPIQNDGVAPMHFTGSHNVAFQSADLKDHLGLVDYPKPIIDQSTGLLKQISVSVYAWSRSFNASNNNDTFLPILIVEKADGQILEQGTYSVVPNPDRPPRYYPSSASGNYPMTWIFSMAGWDKSDKIKRVVIKVSQTTETETLIEHVKITNVATIFSDGHTNTAWEHDKDNSRYKLEYKGRPFIMFSTVPSRAQYFQAWAEFDTANISDGSAWGIAAFATDSQNYIVARMNATSNGMIYPAIVEVREGQETQIIAGSNIANPGRHHIMFEHTYGRLRMHMRAAGATSWTQLLTTVLHFSPTIDAAAASSDIMHIGVYGLINPPKLRISKYTYLDPSLKQKNDGIGILPGYETALANFPSSGTIQIGEAFYNYGAKLTPSSLTGNLAWGPFQPYQIKDYAEIGSGADISLYKYGETNNLTGYFLSTDTGYSWEISASNWDINNEFKSRHFGTSMKDNYLGQSNRTYITGGFKAITNPINAQNHSHGDWAFKQQSDIIYLYKYAVSSGEGRANMRDMIDSVLSSAGVKSIWADYVASTLALTAGNYTYLRISQDKSPRGFDITWQIPEAGGIANDKWIGIYYARGFKIGSTLGHIVGVRKTSGGEYFVCALDDSYNVLEQISVGTSPGIFKFVFYKKHCTVFEGGAWAHTFFFDDFGTTNNDAVAFYVPSGYGSNPTIRNVTMVELFQERASVFFELSANPQSVLSSIFQERPIQLIPKSDGSFLVSYYNCINSAHCPTAYSINQNIIHGHLQTERRSKNSASDIIAYYSDMKVFFSNYHRKNKGFRTVIYSLPNIDDDEIDFIISLLTRLAFEETRVYQISMRNDLRIEPGDLINVSYTLSGTNTAINLGELYVLSTQYSTVNNKLVVTARSKADPTIG